MFSDEDYQQIMIFKNNLFVAILLDFTSMSMEVLASCKKSTSR